MQHGPQNGTIYFECLFVGATATTTIDVGLAPRCAPDIIHDRRIAIASNDHIKIAMIDPWW